MSSSSKITVLCFFLFLCIHSATFAFRHPGHEKFVVVRVYPNSFGAEKYAKELSAQGLNAKVLEYAYPGKRNLFYVYTSSSENIKTSLSKSREMRTKDGFEKTWVFVMPSNGNTIASQHPKVHDNKSAIPVKSDNNISIENNTVEKSTDIKLPSEKDISGESELIKSDKTATEADNSEELEVPTDQDLTEMNLPDNNLKHFNLMPISFNMRTEKLIPATVNIVDGAKETLVASTKSNTFLQLQERKNKRHKLQFIATTPGYKEVILDIDLDDPINDTTSLFSRLNSDTLFVDFAMRRLRKGEVQTLYHIFFFKDATIMKRQSKYELAGLLGLMKENPSTNIKVHGHTNGNSFGKMIKLVEDDTNFFELTKNNKQTAAGAVELSKQRALTIKRYLVNNGIDESRIDVKGWGGKQMLYDKDHPLAVKNIRVEVEITED